MLFVLGAGSFAPGEQLTDELLRELGVSPDGPVNLQRPSTLNLELLRASRNSDLLQTVKAASPSCTDMGEQAARQAVERAGLTVDQIGLVIGDCATPVEVTPSEGQRIAGRLGLKVPAYDIYTTQGICPAHLSILSTWRKERLPRYTLCVSTNAPTQRIDYSHGSEGWMFADGASACVVSAEDMRGLELVWSRFSVDTARTSTFELDTLGHIRSHGIDAAAVRAQAGELFSALADDVRISEDLRKSMFFWSLADLPLQQDILQAAGGPLGEVINSHAEIGNMLGTSSLYQLAAHWGSFEDKQMIGVLVAEGSINYGGAVFRVRRGA